MQHSRRIERESFLPMKGFHYRLHMLASTIQRARYSSSYWLEFEITLNCKLIQLFELLDLCSQQRANFCSRIKWIYCPSPPSRLMFQCSQHFRVSPQPAARSWANSLEIDCAAGSAITWFIFYLFEEKKKSSKSYHRWKGTSVRLNRFDTTEKKTKSGDLLSRHRALGTDSGKRV